MHLKIQIPIFNKIPLFCKHDYEFRNTIHGDMIMHMGGNRSVWRCTKCGKFKHRKEYIDKDQQLQLVRLRKIKKIKDSIPV